MISQTAKHFLAGTALGLAMLFGPQAAMADDALNTAQKTEIESVIEQYLLENPDVLLRAIQNVQTWQTAEQARKTEDALAPVWDALVADSSVPSIGPVDAPVTVIEFFDYHCGYCKRAFDGVMDIAEKNEGKIRTIFVEFPILRQESTLAARAALAAAKQGKYMEIHEAFMKDRDILDQNRITELATGTGIDVDQMLEDMEAPEINDMLSQYSSMARAVGINGTPAFLINGTMVSGANMERVEALVDAGLEDAS